MFKLSDIKKELPIKIQRNVYVGHLKYVLDRTNRFFFDFDVYLPSKGINLQRELCWTLDQKRELIISVIKGIDIPPFYIINYTPDDKQIVYKVVDGKQRLTTLFDFCADKFTLEYRDNEYLYSELPNDIRNEIDSFSLHVNQTYEYYDDLIPDDVKIDWFEQINYAGTPQDMSHLDKLRNTKI